MKDFDVCIIGSGAGASPVAYTLAGRGHDVVVLEKGPWFHEDDFTKDELACCLRNVYASDPENEPQVIEMEDDHGQWRAQRVDEAGFDFWNGNCVGGSTNFMSGSFYRLKPVDFHLLSEFGPIEGADVADWPISYEDLEPYYARVEREVGVSGRVIEHPQAEPRSTRFPYPATSEHAIAGMLDRACEELGFHSLPTPRAILPYPAMGRGGCMYNGGLCGSTGCSTGAKGSGRAALLERALTGGHCRLYPGHMVTRLVSDTKGRVVGAEYRDFEGKTGRITAKVFVVACQAIETARLLLMSTGPRYPDGLANGSGLVGKNLLFAGGGAGSGRLPLERFEPEFQQRLRDSKTFINRSLQDWYVIDDPDFGPRQKGGTIGFMPIHPNPVGRAIRQMRGTHGLVWGKALKRRLESHFLQGPLVKIEAFCDWLPVRTCHVRLDPKVRDCRGLPVARIKAGFHVRNLQLGWYLAARGAEVLRKIGAEDVVSFASGAPPANLQAGTCRFGKDPDTSVLDPDCRSHQAENLFITDGSFMPTAGSAPYTFTIYANAFRVAERIAEQLGQTIGPDNRGAVASRRM
uniref:Choline dehydrogenase n=1 Tax=Candidatus Kentrum sp. LFY TaxID=2126342 RepID=A0A450WWW0_9GAMM|nr:MAG: Choline dehydrogenase [Candidatus Kentron sp. LFY]